MGGELLPDARTEEPEVHRNQDHSPRPTFHHIPPPPPFCCRAPTPAQHHLCFGCNHGFSQRSLPTHVGRRLNLQKPKERKGRSLQKEFGYSVLAVHSTARFTAALPAPPGVQLPEPPNTPTSFSISFPRQVLPLLFNSMNSAQLH